MKRRMRSERAQRAPNTSANISQPSQEVEEALLSLEREIRAHRLALGREGPLDLTDTLAEVRERRWVNSHLPIGWPVMPKGFLPKVIAYAQKIVRRLLRWYINPIVDQQNAFNQAVCDALDELVTTVHEHLRTPDREAADLDLILWRLRRLELRFASPSQPSSSAGSVALPPSAFDAFILGLEHRNPQTLGERVKDYDDILKPWGAQNALRETPLPVLEVHSGRGDMLAHLQEMGLPAYGVEENADAVEWARAQGLDVRAEAPLAHLAALDEGALGAILAIQAVEHWPIGEVARFLSLAAQKLAPGGMLILETINPTCLTALLQAYLLDPSHRTPLHPQTLRFLAEQTGFFIQEVRFLRPVPPEARLMPWPMEAGAWAEIANANIARLNDLLFGAQDYALIATWPGK